MIKRFLTFSILITLTTSLFAATNLTNLEKNNVVEFVYEWFSLFDNNAQSIEFEKRMTNNPYFRFPEAELKSVEDFINWYKHVLETYKDPSHDIGTILVTKENPLTYNIELVVLWKARIIKTDEAVAFEARQNWVVVLENNQFEISKYLVKENKDF